MCNLSEGIYERGTLHGGHLATERIVLNMLKRRLPVALISEYTGVSKEMVEEIKRRNGFVTRA